MFKDLYKNANDKIPTQDAYLRVMERVNSESRKTKYPYMKVAALAACFVLTVAMVSVYEKSKPSVETPIEPANVITETVPTPASVEVKPDATQKPQKVITKAPENKKVLYNHGIPEGAGISVARFTQEGEIVTSKEYAEYIGKDIEEAILLPEGFENQSPQEQILVLEEGENFNDQWTYYFEGEDASVFVTTSKKTDDVKNIIDNPEYQKSDILDCEVAIFEEEMQKLAFFEKQSIGYTVTGMNVSDGDFENILKSLVK